MPEKRHRFVNCIDDRSYVLEFPVQLVLVCVAALADATTIHRVDRAVVREGGADIG
jgi:hypothetical protein